MIKANTPPKGSYKPATLLEAKVFAEIASTSGGAGAAAWAAAYAQICIAEQLSRIADAMETDGAEAAIQRAAKPMDTTTCTRFVDGMPVKTTPRRTATEKRWEKQQKNPP